MNVCLNHLHLMTQLAMNLSSSIASEPYDAFLETDIDKKHVERISFQHKQGLSFFPLHAAPTQKSPILKFAI